MSSTSDSTPATVIDRIVGGWKVNVVVRVTRSPTRTGSPSLRQGSGDPGDVEAGRSMTVTS